MQKSQAPQKKSQCFIIPKKKDTSSTLNEVESPLGTCASKKQNHGSEDDNNSNSKKGSSKQLRLSMSTMTETWELIDLFTSRQSLFIECMTCEEAMLLLKKGSPSEAFFYV